MEQLGSKSEGALTPRKVEELTKPSKGLLSYVTFGYYGKSSEENDVQLDNRITYLIVKSSLLRGLNRGAEAMKCIEEAIEYKPYVNDKQTLVMILIESGRCHAKNGDMETCYKCFKDALKVSNYGWDDVIKNRIRSYMNQMDKEVSVDEDDGLDGEDQQQIEDEMSKMSKEETE